MDDEVQSLIRRYTLEDFPRNFAANHIILPGTWSFKCKRDHDGTIRKSKARYFVREYFQNILSPDPLL